MVGAESSTNAAAGWRPPKYAICLTLAVCLGGAGWWFYARLEQGRRDLEEWRDRQYGYSAAEAAEAWERIARRMGLAYYALPAEDKAWVHRQLGGSFWLEGNYASAFEALRKAKQLDSTRPRIHPLAYLAALAKRADWLGTLTERPPADSSPEDLAFFRACLAWALENPSRVLEMADECSRGASGENEIPSKGSLWLCFMRAKALMEIGQYERALDLLDNHVASSGKRLRAMTDDIGIVIDIGLVGAEAAEKCGQYEHALAIAQVVARELDKYTDKSLDRSKQDVHDTIRRLEERVHASEIK